MEMFYNSEDYCVVEFSGFGKPGDHQDGGFEIVDKWKRVGFFIHGVDAVQFRVSIVAMRDKAISPTTDDVDEFLEQYSGLMMQRIILH